MREHAAHCPSQLGQAAPAARRTRHDRNAERVLERGHVDADALAACLVHQVEAEYCTRRQLEHLQHKDQVALKTGRIRDQNDCLRPARGEKITRGLFLS